MGWYSKKIEENWREKADKTDGKNTYIEMDKTLPDGKRDCAQEIREAKNRVTNQSEKELKQRMEESRKNAEQEQMAQLDDRIESNNFQ